MNKVCIVVGGSRGLGAALIERYQSEGFYCLEFSRSGNSAGHVDADLSRKETAIDAIDQTFASIAGESPEQVVLLLNAAILTPIGELAGSEPKQWWGNLDANLTMPISILGRFQYHFNDLPIKKTAAFVSSGAAVSAFAGWGLYCAAKAGVEHFIRAMAIEQDRKEHPIQCAILDPGMMDTEMQATIRDCTVEQCPDIDFFVERYKQGGLAQPAVVADNTFNLLSKPFENGARLDVAGYER